MNKSLLYRLDWLSLLIYITLVSFGILNIYAHRLERVDAIVAVVVAIRAARASCGVTTEARRSKNH